MSKIDLCELVSKDTKQQEKKVERQSRERFTAPEEKITYIVEQNYKPKGINYGDLNPVESCLIDTFVSDSTIRRIRLDTDSSEEAIKKTLLFDVLLEFTGARRGNYDVSKMSVKKFSQYFALNLVDNAMEMMLETDDTGEALFDKMASGGHRSQVRNDGYHEFRRPSILSEMVAEKYLSLFRQRKTKDAVMNANNAYDLKYLLVTDICSYGAEKKAKEKINEYLEKGEAKKAAVYSVLQSIKDDLFF